MPGGLFKSPNLEGYTTAMNVSHRAGLGADGIVANEPYFKLSVGGLVRALPEAVLLCEAFKKM